MGQPITGAAVLLLQVDGPRRTQRTDAAGRFLFPGVQRRAGSVTVQVDGQAPASQALQFSARPTLQLGFALHAAADASKSDGSKQALQFTDEPDFQVAGITDWTAVGGHGSDLTLRASEELARDTSALATPDSSATSDGPLPLDRQQESKLRASLDADPSSYKANHQLGVFYLEARHFQEASRVLKAAAALNGHAARDEYDLAQACVGLGDLPEARRHLALAMKQQENATFHRLAGEIDERSGDPLGAVREDQRATQLQPSEDNYLAWGAELLVHRAIWQAADIFAKAAQLYPHSARTEAAWGAALFAGARYDEAAQHLCSASELAPSNREPYLLLGKAVLGSPAPLACATNAFARFLQLYPDDADASFYAAMQRLKTHSATEEPPPEALLRKVVALKPHYAQAWLQLGILATSKHANDDALRDLQQAIAADPQLAEAHYRLGVLYDRAGRHAEAQGEFQTHEILTRQQAEAVERDRRQLKQFTVVPDTVGPSAPKQ